MSLIIDLTLRVTKSSIVSLDLPLPAERSLSLPAWLDSFKNALLGELHLEFTYGEHWQSLLSLPQIMK